LCTMGGDWAKHHLTWSPTQSIWFERFAQGCIRRMGQDIWQDWAIPLGAMHGLMAILEEEFAHVGNARHSNFLASLGAYALIAFCGSSRAQNPFWLTCMD